VAAAAGCACGVAPPVDRDHRKREHGDDVKAGVLAVAMALAGGSAALAARTALVPGHGIGAMTIVRGGWSKHLPSIFSAGDPLITKPGFYRRRCIVPRFDRVFIGYGDFLPTLPRLDRAWRHEQWQLYVDGREIYLPAFGTVWRIVVGPGVHTICYISIQDSGLVDVTFAVRIA
jgi:hypothetical protein